MKQRSHKFAIPKKINSKYIEIKTILLKANKIVQIRYRIKIYKIKYIYKISTYNINIIKQRLIHNINPRRSMRLKTHKNV